METLESKTGWEIVEEKWPGFTGTIFKDTPKNAVESLETTVGASG